MALLWLILIVLLNSLSKYIINRYLKDNLIMLPRIVGTMTVLFQFVLVYLAICYAFIKFILSSIK